MADKPKLNYALLIIERDNGPNLVSVIDMELYPHPELKPYDSKNLKHFIDEVIDNTDDYNEEYNSIQLAQGVDEYAFDWTPEHILTDNLLVTGDSSIEKSLLEERTKKKLMKGIKLIKKDANE